MVTKNYKLQTSNPVRTRFAPSPTGYVHVGGIRTALFCWLLSRQQNGKFVLRIEDTDKRREVKGAEKYIIESLRALGLEYDEGPDIGGPFGPYRQSERLDSYKKWAHKLIDKGRAYADATSEADLKKLRQAAVVAGKPFLFRDHRPAQSPEWRPGLALRFKSEPKAYNWRDEVMGDLSTDAGVVDDFILLKSDGYPTYNFSHIVDDAEMQISHIIRGQEFIASTPNYLNLYEALELKPPAMATVPHILGPSGNKKLSKRDDAKDVLEYIRQGYLPDALINFIASLGWNDGTEQEIFTRQELVEKFSLSHIHRSGARFDEKRLEWMNGHYIRETALDNLYKLSENFWPPAAQSAKEKYKKAVLAIVQERLKFLAELPDLTWFFFDEPQNGQVNELLKNTVDKQLQKSDKTKWLKMLQGVKKELEESDFAQEDIAKRLNSLLGKLGTKPGVLFALVRIVISGSKATPELSATLHVLGKDKSLDRLKRATAMLES